MYLNTLSHSCSVIAVSETWATADSETLLLLSGYVGISKNRPKSRKGGVAVFVRDSISFSKRLDLDIYDNEDFESICIDIDDKKIAKHTIGAIYRPP